MELDRQKIVTGAAELHMKLDELKNQRDKFIEYKNAKCGGVYGWLDLENKEYVIFIAQETNNHTHIEGFAIYDNRNNTCPHYVRFDKQQPQSMFIDITGRNTGETIDNIQDFVNSFIKETEFNETNR